METNAKKLLCVLIDATKNRTIQWLKTGNNDEYKTKFQNGSILMVYKVQTYIRNAFLGLDLSENLSYNFRLYNQDGVVIQTIEHFAEKDDKQLIESLYKTIENAEKKEDETYSSIFRELGTDFNSSAI
ncbi:MAG: hypothetical protein ABW019_11355 [Chitinophagaceae bacterium]